MAKITCIRIPEPKSEVYDSSQSTSITLDALDTLINQLNFGYQKDLKDEQDDYNYFLS
jgi:hypothetical protein